MATNTDGREEIKPVAPTEQTKWRDPSLVGKYMVDPKTGLAGLFRSPDNGETWVLTDTVYGHVYNQDEVDNIWDNGAGHKVADEVKSATADLPNVRKQADEAVKFAESAIAASKVNGDAIVAQSEAISEAKSAMDSATAEIQQLKANAASDVAQIRADVAQVQNEVDTAKAANSASVDKLKSDIGLAQKDLDNVHDSLAKAQSAVEQNQKLINDSVAKINSDIAQSRQDIVTAQQANNDLAKQLDTYSKEAQEQGKTIKTIQDNQDGFSITIADVKGDVTKVSDTVDGLSAGLKDAQGNIASVKAQADQLNATLTDHSKDIAQLTATAKELSSTLEDADGRLSKAEQTASEQSTTLSDLQGNLTQVKQTADNLVTTLKDAQGNIDQIKQDAKGTLEQLSNAQGDITALQKDVSGIKLTIADHEKNIHTLQADSKTLKDDMADAKGNISSLQKTSTSLVSEFRDHDGRLSKVEQTATEHTSELADTKGNLDKVTQKANTLQLLLSDAQKNIQNIQLDAKGLHDTLTGQGNQLASLNVTLNNLDSKYSGITGDLQSKQTALSTEQQQTKDVLLRKADKSEVDNVKGTVNQVSAEQKTMADQINQKVSSTEYQTLKDKVNGMHVGGRNLLKGTRDFNSKYWYQSGDHTALADNPADSSTKEIHSWQDWYSFKNNQTIQLDPSKDYMISADIAIYGGDGSGLYVTPYGTIDGQGANLVSTDINLAGFPKQANGEGFRRIYLPMTKHGHTLNDFRIEGHGNWNAGSGSVFISKIALYEGNTKQGWEDSSDDLIENIQKNTTAIDENSKLISLMAKQTEVDNVKNTAQQISSRLDILAGEVKSKVDETRVNNIVDGKGYATTSTVQSLVDQKAGTINESITNLEGKFNSSSSVNLAEKTNQGTTNWMCDPGNGASSISEVNINGVRGVRFTQTRKSTSWWVIAYQLNLDYFEPNQDYIISFDIRTSSDNFNQGGMLNIARGDSSHPYLANTSFKTNFKQNQLTHVSCTGRSYSSLDKNGETFYLNCVGLGQCDWVDIVNFKIARGKIDKGYSPAPSDNATVTQVQSLTASIDGIQGVVKSKADQSTVAQLANTYQVKLTGNLLASLGKKAQKYTVGYNTFFPFASIDVTKVTKGTVLTLSFDYSSDADCAFAPQLDGTPWVPWGDIKDNPISVKANVPGHYVKQITIGDDSWTKGTAKNIAIRIDNFGGTFTVSNLTLRSGDNVASTFDMLQYDMDLRVQKGDLLSQINLTAGNTLIQSNKLYLDASSVVFSGRAFIPSAAITNIDADKITTGTLNGIDIHQIATKEGRSIDISGGNITLSSSDPYESRLSFKYQGQMVKMFNATGDLEADTWGIFNFSPSDTQNLHPIQFFRINNVGGKGSGSARMQLDHAIFDGHEWWANFDGITFGRSYDGINGSNDYVDLYAKSFLPHSQLSSKTRIEKLNGEDAMNMIKQVQMYTYQFKDDVRDGKTKRYASLIIDDVHDVAQYTEPDIFVADNKKCRDDGTQLAYAIAAIQYQQHEIEELKVQLKEKKANE